MFDNLLETFSGITAESLVNVAVALGILLGGWILARIAAFLVKRLVRRTKLHSGISNMLSSDQEISSKRVDGWVSGIVFWLIMLFVLVAFFQTLQLTAISDPLSSLLNELLSAGPQLLGAALILLVGWVIAGLARALFSRLLSVSKLEERLSDSADIDASALSTRESLSTGIFWIVFLLFLPAVLNTLGMQGLVEPVQGVVDQALSAIPRFFGAAVLLFAGWVIARIVRQIVANLLKAANVDRLGERIGLDDSKQSLTDLLATTTYVLVFIPVVIAALNALEIEALSGPAIAMLSSVLNGVPAFFGAVIILGVAYYVGRFASGFVTNILSGLGLDRVPARLGFKVDMEKNRYSLSEIGGLLTLVGLMLLASTEAANLLGLNTLGSMISNFAVWGSQAIVGLIIFAVGLYLANLSRDVIVAASGEDARFMANIARVGIMIFVLALALQQLGVDSNTVNLAFGTLLGAVAISAALAFGLGARDVAGEQVKKWVDKASK